MAVLVGKKAPAFSAAAVVNGSEFVDDFSLEQYVGKKYVVFFFYPADFTFVCPTEIIAFQENMEEFEKRNVAVVGLRLRALSGIFKKMRFLIYFFFSFLLGYINISKHCFLISLNNFLFNKLQHRNEIHNHIHASSSIFQ